MLEKLQHAIQKAFKDQYGNLNVKAGFGPDGYTVDIEFDMVDNENLITPIVFESKEEEV